MRFLAIGECMAELAPADTPATFGLGFAGDTFNTAWYLARLRPEVAVSYLSAVGEDAISAQMLEAMGKGGIGTDHIARLPGQTVGLYLITLDKGERSFSYWRGQAAARQLASDPARLDDAMDQADTLFFSGITLAILPQADRSNLLRALAKARSAGKTIAFDPNLRSRLWPSADEMTDAISEGAAVSDIALPSFEDEETFFNDADPDATADRYLAAGCSTVVVKNGALDVLFHAHGQRGTVPVTPVANVVDTTAAGDSFNAGVFAGLAQGQPLPKAIAGACALSARVVQGKGALVPV